jgi:hypothetical protein
VLLSSTCPASTRESLRFQVNIPPHRRLYERLAALHLDKAGPPGNDVIVCADVDLQHDSSGCGHVARQYRTRAALARVVPDLRSYASSRRGISFLVCDAPRSVPGRTSGQTSLLVLELHFPGCLVE